MLYSLCAFRCGNVYVVFDPVEPIDAYMIGFCVGFSYDAVFKG